MTAAYTIGIDIGGTKVAGGVVDAEGRVHARARADTPHRSTSPQVVESTIVGVVQDLLAQVEPDSVGAVGIAGATLGMLTGTTAVIYLIGQALAGVAAGIAFRVLNPEDE